MENTKQHVIELENQYWQAIVDKDLESALRLSEDPCVVAGAQGAAVLDHATFRSMMNDATWKLHSFDLADVQVTRAGDNLALTSYVVTENLTVEGTQLTLKAAETSAWLLKDGEWKCVLHTESLLGDPFGRDKVAAKPVKKPAAKKAASKKPAPSMRRNASSRRPKAKR